MQLKIKLAPPLPHVRPLYPVVDRHVLSDELPQAIAQRALRRRPRRRQLRDRTDDALRLLDGGADVDGRNHNDCTALFITCGEGHVDVATLLLNRGADVERAVRGFTPLFIACETGHYDVVQLCLDRGADVDRQEEAHGETPFWCACGMGHVAAATLCLDAGANLDHQRGWDGATPLQQFFYLSLPQLVGILSTLFLL